MNSDRYHCGAAAYGQHDDRGDGVCAWCGVKFQAAPEVNWQQRQPADELHPRIDPVTLEPDEGSIYE